jgi:hypothetical protein
MLFSSRALATGLCLTVVLTLQASPAYAKGSWLSGLFKGLGKGVGKAASKGVGKAVGRTVSRAAARAASRTAARAAASAAKGAARGAAQAAQATARVAAQSVPLRQVAAHPIAAERLREIVHQRGVTLRAAPAELTPAQLDAGSRSVLAMRAEATVPFGAGLGEPPAPLVVHVRYTFGAKTRSASTATTHTTLPRRRPINLRLPSGSGRAVIARLASVADELDGGASGGQTEGDVLSSEEVPLSSSPLDEADIADPELDRDETVAQGERATAPRAVSLLELTLEPVDADLWLDGVQVSRVAGRTVTLGLTGGSHLLEVVHPQHRGMAVSLVADPGQRYRLSLTLPPAPTAPSP